MRAGNVHYRRDDPPLVARAGGGPRGRRGERHRGRGNAAHVPGDRGARRDATRGQCDEHRGALARIAPFLVLGATVLFLVQRPLARLQTASRAVAEGPNAPFLAAQFLVAVYGGYFGAGIGILMLAALGLMGLTNIHRMNGLKNWGGMCINGVAVVMFAAGGIIHWPIALTMAAGGVIGGYAGARLAQRVGQERVRGAIVAIGLAAFIWLLYHH